MRCAYNLRGLLRSGRCPECGEPVVAALRADQLRYAPTAWLRRLIRGVDALAGMGWMLLVGALLGLGATAFGAVEGSETGFSVIAGFVFVVLVIPAIFLLCGACVMLAVAAFLLATPDPRRRPSKLGKTGRAVRWLLFLPVALGGAVVLNWRSGGASLQWSTVLWVASCLALPIMVLVHARAIARRTLYPQRAEDALPSIVLFATAYLVLGYAAFAAGLPGDVVPCLSCFVPLWLVLLGFESQRFVRGLRAALSDTMHHARWHELAKFASPDDLTLDD